MPFSPEISRSQGRALNEFPLQVSTTASRPQVPDAGVVADATRRLSEVRQAEVDPEWRVVLREVRHRSTVFKLRTSCDGGPVVAYYKQLHRGLDHEQEGHGLVRARDAMLVEDELSERLFQAMAAIDVEVDRPLVLVPERLIGVRLAVAGVPLGKAIASAVPGRRTVGRLRSRRLGASMRVVEEVGATLSVPADTPTVADRLRHELRRSVAAVSPHELRRLESLIASWTADPVADRQLTWTHGDLSPTNVLVDGSKVGLIDFSWAPHLPGRDIAQFVSRIATERPRLNRWMLEVVEWILDGYALGYTGTRRSWQLARLERAIKAMRSHRNELRVWARATLEELYDEHEGRGG